MFGKLRKLWYGKPARKMERFEHVAAPSRSGLGAGKYGSDPFKARKGAGDNNTQQRQGSDEDQQHDLYTMYGLIEPPYNFADCWTDYEQGDVLSECVDALVRNCERPHEIEFVGEDIKLAETEAELANKRRLVDFCKRVNERHSLLSLRKKLRIDREVTGNAFCEVIRNLTGQTERLYYVPSTYVRCTEQDDTNIRITVSIPRDGKRIDVTIIRKFRKFGRIITTSGQIRWFKELGDPRQLNAKTGEWLTDDKGRFLCLKGKVLDPKTGQYASSKHNTFIKPAEQASELWWFRDYWGGNVYGIARWIPVMLQVRARYLAQWLNHDLLTNGGVPKGIVLFQNGTISKETQDHIRQTLQEWGDPRKFNQWILLNIEPDVFNIDLGTGSSKAASAKPEFINLDRNEDYMFREYLAHCEEAIRKIYRLSPVFVGGSAEYTHATAYAAQEAAETQVFGPLRDEFDEKFTVELIQAEFEIYNWRLKTKRARIGDEETFYRAVGMWSRAGLSWNQMVQLGNEMLGTHFNQRTGELWDMPWDAVKTLLSSGLYRIGDDALERVEPQAEKPIEQSTKSDASLPDTIDDAVTLSRVLRRINERAQHKYEPPVITAADSIL